MLTERRTLCRQFGEADPIAARTPCRAGSTLCIEIHTDKELEVFAVCIVEQVFKCRGDVRLRWITNVQGKSVESVGLLEECCINE